MERFTLKELLDPAWVAPGDPADYFRPGRGAYLTDLLTAQPLGETMAPNSVFTVALKTYDGLAFNWCYPTRQEAAFALSSLILELTGKNPLQRYEVSASHCHLAATEVPIRATRPPDAPSSPFDNEFRSQKTYQKPGPDAEHY